MNKRIFLLGGLFAALLAGPLSAQYVTNSPIPSGIGSVGGRLTLNSGSPAVTNGAGKTIVYLSPYKGQRVPIYNGAAFAMRDTGGELSNDITASSVGNSGPAAAEADSNYDFFVWDDAGTLRLTRGPKWTTATARGTGAGTTELVRVQGVFLNTVAITNGPAAQRGTYFGTARTNAAGTIDFSYGAPNAAIVFGVWNYFNRIRQSALTAITGSNWTYASTTIRAANGGTSMRASAINGMVEEGVSIVYRQVVTSPAAISYYTVGIGDDSITTITTYRAQHGTDAASATGMTLTAGGPYIQQLGWHYWAAVEAGDGTNTYTMSANAPNNSLSYEGAY